jgi:hypothetical protein
MKYTEIKFSIQNNDVAIEVTKNKIESNGKMKITEINFQKEKEKIKKNLLNKDEGDDADCCGVVTKRHRKRR